MVRKIDKWQIDEIEVERELSTGTIPNEMICLGCAAKVSLTDTVYPALNEVKNRISHFRNVRFQQRDDSYYFRTDKQNTLERVVAPLQSVAMSKQDTITKALKAAGSGGAILLFNFTPQPGISFFTDVLVNTLQSMEDAGVNSIVGKGHTIQLARIPEETLVMADFIGHAGGNYWGLANNDTISTVDPMLPHTHKYPVSIALNNTLNDLFVYGITGDFLIYPSYDARDEEDVEDIRSALKWYENRFSDIGIEIVDLGPLRTNNKLVGATVIGFTDREIPVNTGLVPGQKIIASRPIGDLAPLNEYLIRVSLDEDLNEIEHLRRKMIHTMLIPNVEIAKIIRDYLPQIGEKIDPAKHITATRDMSGPGMLALEELSEDSLCDVFIHDIRFHDEMIPGIEVTNVTAGTNGAILIAAQNRMSDEIFARLEEAGYDPWIVATVGEKSDKPAIILDESLRRFSFLTYGRGFYRNYRFGTFT
jgi:selenophosphate synthase